MSRKTRALTIFITLLYQGLLIWIWTVVLSNNLTLGNIIKNYQEFGIINNFDLILALLWTTAVLYAILSAWLLTAIILSSPKPTGS